MGCGVSSVKDFSVKKKNQQTQKNPQIIVGGK